MVRAMLVPRLHEVQLRRGPGHAVVEGDAGAEGVLHHQG